MDFTAEGQRLKAADQEGVPWRRWGPYLSDRQWGTVREDYSENGDAWSYFTHDQSRSRAYRWGEDGIAGVSDDQQHLCLSLALWNHADRSSRSGSSASPTRRATTARTSRSTTSTSTTPPPTPTCGCSISTRRPPTPT